MSQSQKQHQVGEHGKMVEVVYRPDCSGWTRLCGRCVEGKGFSGFGDNRRACRPGEVSGFTERPFRILSGNCLVGPHALLLPAGGIVAMMTAGRPAKVRQLLSNFRKPV